MFEVSSPMPSKLLSRLRAEIGEEVRREQAEAEEKRRAVAAEREKNGAMRR